MERQWRELADCLERWTDTPCTATIGFDGFLDEVFHVVKTRQDAEHYQRVETLADYGRMITDAAGLSLNVEMVPVSRKMGGNGVIMANSMAELGTRVNYLGALGEGEIRPEFAPLCRKAKVISFGEPGYTEAIEFFDGKIIASQLNCLKQINWERLKGALPVEALAALLDESALIGYENWSLLVCVNSIWEGILREAVPLMRTDSREKLLYFDLADPAKRTAADLRNALSCISRYQDWFQVVLGVNQREAAQLVRLLEGSPEQMRLGELAAFLQARLGISLVTVHSVRQAAASGGGETVTVDGPYCPNPAITTGAGDHFNAGFAFGLLHHLPLKEALLLGCANSGYYVRQMHSPSLRQLKDFVEKLREQTQG